VKLFSHKSTGRSDIDRDVRLAWRPDFRELESLPDLKTVRTSFFLNMTGLALALGAILYTAHRELTLSSLNRNLQDITVRTEQASSQSKKAVQEYALFEAERKKFEEIKSIGGSMFRLSDILIHLSENKPDNIIFSKIELRQGGQSILLGATIAGQDVAANVAVSNYEKMLRTDTVLIKYFPEIQLTNVVRDQSVNRLLFELLFSVKQPEPKATAGGRK